MKKFAFAALAALAVTSSFAGIAKAGYYDDYSGYDAPRYHHRDYGYENCYIKKVKWYDDYGYAHWKRERVCD